MTMADRIAVMNNGRVEQLASPAEIYDRPATPFAARFIGELSELEGMLAGDHVALGDGTHVPVGRRLAEVENGARVRIGLRPEAAVATLDDGAAADDGALGTGATVATAMVVGDRLQLVARLADGQELLLRQRRGGDDATLAAVVAGERVRLHWETGAAIVLERADNAAAPPDEVDAGGRLVAS